ncbi:MAG: hypothetical protein PHZ25_03460, partial [Candidatus Pacebacteria bacterium]|nr:hypothetical protein [Candidatus Paceibacterota bacterium]
MKKIEYKKLKLDDLNENTDELFIHFSGFRIITKKDSDGFLFNLDDEIIDDPFSEKTIESISKI